MIISSLLGIFIGMIMGLSGAGGGILAVPALMASMGWSLQQAAPVALLAVTAGAAVGAIEGFRRGLVRYRAALLMALVGVPFTLVGARVGHYFPHTALATLFALIMLLVAVRLLRPAPARSTEEALFQTHAQSGRIIWSGKVACAIAAIGALTGFATGLLGVGGGFIIVPTLRKLSNLSMHAIVATSLFVISMVGSGGIVSTLLNGASLPLWVALPFVSTTLVGMVAGRLLAHKASQQQVQRLFAMVLVSVSVLLLAMTWG